MEDYYRERAPSYDHLYRTSEWQDDFAWLQNWVTRRTAGRSVLEVAAGTGFWTAAAARRAEAIVATDYNAEPLAIAAQRGLGAHVTFLAADAYALPVFDRAFEVGMAHLWWSHVDRRRERQFLSQLAARLQAGAELLTIRGIRKTITCQRSGAIEPVIAMSCARLKTAASFKSSKTTRRPRNCKRV